MIYVSNQSKAIASKVCNQFAKALYNLSRKITIEQVTLVANSVAQCSSNVFTGVNAPLQRRGLMFDPDINQTSETSKETNLNINHDYVDYELLIEIDETMFFIAKPIRRHLNFHQTFPVIYPALRMIVEQIYAYDIENKSIELSTRNASIHLPRNLTFIQSHQIGVRTTLFPLAPAGGNANVGLSTALTFSVLDDNDQEIDINATNEIPIEMFYSTTY